MRLNLKILKVLKDNKLSGTGGALLGALKYLNEDFIVIFFRFIYENKF